MSRNNPHWMDEDMQMALAISMSLEGGGGFGGDAEPIWSSSSQNPKSGNKVGVESQLIHEYKSAEGKVIQVRDGDMTKETVDVIVNAANKQLDHASGLAGAIVKNGGEMIQIESDIYISENGPVPDGEIAITNAGELSCKKIIHAVGPTWHGGQEGEEFTLRQCVWKSLKATEQLGLHSISIPAISSGIFRFPKDLCAKILFDTALDFFKSSPSSSVNEIRFTNFDKTTVEFFSKEFVRRFGSSGSSATDSSSSSSTTSSSSSTTTTTTSPTTQGN
jgi:O-acetyl-ADP-ribose deacetylase (regulator of RNase III)